MCFNYEAVSFSKRILSPLIFALGMSSMAQAQSSVGRARVTIDVVELSGATHLPEGVQEQLVASLKQREFEEGSDWVQELENIVVRAETGGWPDRENQGYIGFSVEARWRPLTGNRGYCMF
jgi:hypothetical protein